MALFICLRAVLVLEGPGLFISRKNLKLPDIYRRYFMKRVFRNARQKATAILIVIMALLLFNNVADRKSFRNVQESFSSIYNDRLMPATYIFSISDHLYQNRLLMEADEHNPLLHEELKVHDEVIAMLISNYETTYLTDEESKQWASFKEHLYAYNRFRADPARDQITTAHFSNALQCLNTLSQIQVGEGGALHKNSRAIIDGTNAFSEFEISLVMILGVISVVLIGLPEKAFTGYQTGRFSLN